MTVHDVATWDGATWAPIGDGLPGHVRALALDDAGTLWAVGTVDPYEDSDYVARLDGTAWTLVADGEKRIFGIAAIAEGIVVHGGFDSIAGVETHGLAVWNGVEWSARGLDPNSFITAVTRTVEGFCAGGRLAVMSNGIVLRDGAACREGTAWTELGAPIRGFPRVMARAPDGRWWAGGGLEFMSSELPETITARGIAYLADDGTWAPLDGGVHDGDSFFPSPTVNAILFEDDGVMVAGRFVAVGPDRVRASGLARWSPAGGWVPVAGFGSSLVTEVTAVLVDGARLHIGGSFAGVGETLALHVATIEADDTVTPWTGGRVALGPYAYVVDIVETPDGVVVAGDVSAGGEVNASGALFRDGWQPLPGQPRFRDTAATEVLADGSLVLSGEFVRRWDGAAWTPIVDDRTLGSPLLVDADGGLYFAVPFVGGQHVMRWRDGATTSLGVVEGNVVELTTFKGALVALVQGFHDQVPSRIMIRRETTWEQIDGAPSGALVRVAGSPELGLVVSSHFGITAWDGTAWSVVFSGPTSSIAACEGGLFATRSRYLDGRLTRLLMFYDGVWQSLGEEEPGGFTALAPTADGLYVGVYGSTEPGLRLWTSRAP